MYHRYRGINLRRATPVVSNSPSPRARRATLNSHDEDVHLFEKSPEITRGNVSDRRDPGSRFSKRERNGDETCCLAVVISAISGALLLLLLHANCVTHRQPLSNASLEREAEGTFAPRADVRRGKVGK